MNMNPLPEIQSLHNNATSLRDQIDTIQNKIDEGQYSSEDYCKDLADLKAIYAAGEADVCARIEEKGGG